MCVFLHACAHLLSHIWHFATPWTVTRLDSLPLGFSRQEYWSGLPFPPLGGLTNRGIKPATPEFPVLSGWFFSTEPPGKPIYMYAFMYVYIICPWRRKWQPTPVFLPGKSHGQRSLVGYSPWGPQRVGHDCTYGLYVHIWIYIYMHI